MLVACALFLAGPAIPSAGTPAADEATAVQLDATHDGSIADAGLTPPLAQAWSVSLPHAASYPLVAEGMVFVLTGNTLFALNQATGATVWSRPVGHQPPGLTYDRGQVFVINHAGIISAFDAATGSLAWSQSLGQWSTAPPTAANGILYVGTEGTLLALRERDGAWLWTAPVMYGDESAPAATDQGVFVSYACQQTYEFEPLAGTQLWHHAGPCHGGGGATPVVASGHVYAHDWAKGNIILSASTGNPEGTFASSSPFFTSAFPTVADGVMYTITGQSAGNSPNATLNAIGDAGFGSTNWTFLGDGKLTTPPIVADGLVYVGSAAGNLYALDANTGATVWSATLATAPSSFAASNGTLVVAAGSTLMAYRTAGAITDPPANQSPPTVEGSAALDENDAADVGIWSGPPSAYTYQWELCDDTGANCADIVGATGHAYDPGAEAYGKILRVKVVATNDNGSSAPIESARTPVLGLATAVPVLSTVPVISGIATGGQQLTTTPGTWMNSATSYAYQWQRCDDTGANCVDIPSATTSEYTLGESDVGSEIRSEVLAHNAVGSASGYVPSAATSVVVDIGAPSILNLPADQAVSLHEDATHDGSIADAGLAPPLTQAWSVTLPGAASYPLIVNGAVFVASGDQALYALNQATGATIWSQPIPGSVGLTYDYGHVFALGYEGLLSSVDPGDGTTAGSTQLGGYGFSSPPTAANGTVYTSVGSGATLFALRESDLAERWTLRAGSGDWSSPAVTAHGVYVSYACQLAFDFSPRDGTMLWNHSSSCGGGGGATPVVADGHVFVRDQPIGNIILSASAGLPEGTFDSRVTWASYGLPAVANGVAYVSESDYSLSATGGSGLGVTKWTFTGDGTLDGSPIVAGGVVYEGSVNGNLYALDAATGAMLWSTNVGFSLQPGSLTAANGTLIVANDTHVVAYRTAGDITDVPSNETLPTIDGPADLSGREVADVGIWSGLPSDYAYQWERCDGTGASCADIGGATGVSYIAPPEDVGVGETLRVRVVATNGVGPSEPVESAPSVSSPLVLFPQPPAQAHALRPRFSGAVGVGQQLSTTNGIWTHDPTSYSYKWQRCDTDGSSCTDITGATSSEYTVASADQGHTLRSRVRARNALGPAPSYAASPLTRAVSAPGRPQLSSVPVVTGNPTRGSQLSTTTGAWTNAPTQFTYRWRRCDEAGANCVLIAKATSSTYTLAAADVGHQIRSSVLASNSAGSALGGYASSLPTALVIGKPGVVTAPQISGVAQVGKSLSVTTGTWNGAPTVYAYQWLRCTSKAMSCKKIAGATSASYKLTSADAKHKLKAVVTASNAAGSSAATTKPSALVTS